MDPKQLFPAHFESVFGKNKVLFPRELKKKDIPKGLKKSIIPKGIKQVHFLTCNKNIPKVGQNLAKYPQKCGKIKL